MVLKRIVLILIAIILSSAPLAVEAKEPNVADCLDGNADCGQEDNQTELNKEQQQENNEQVSAGSLIFDLIKMVFALVFVLALIYFLLKVLNKRNKLFQQVKVLENLGGIAVGSNKSIQIIRVGNQFYLVGIGDNVELLQEITDEAIKNELIENARPSGESSRPGKMLSSLFREKADMGAKTTKGSNFEKMFTDELEKLKQNRKSLITGSGQKEDRHE